MRRTGSFRPAQLVLEPAPWERLQELIAAERPKEVQEYLQGLPPGEVVRAVSRLTAEQQMRLLGMITPEYAGELLELLPGVQVTDILEDLPAEQAASIVEELPSNEQADFLAELTDSEAEAILEHMAPARATSARRLLAYAPDTAGGIMSTEYLAFRGDRTVGDVLEDMRAHGDEYSDYEIQYTYIVDAHDRLIGVLRLRDLVLRKATERLEQIMLRDPLRVTDDTPLEELNRFFDQHAYIGVPVVSRDGLLVGVVRRAAVEEAVGKRATRTFLHVAGLIGEEELRSMPLRHRATRRLAWLSANIGLNVIAASVIALYQETLSAVIILAVFLPIISDMAGNSGNQAVAVSIRELTLGIIRPREYFRVLWKELHVGVINGMVLGALLGIVAGLWKQNVYLGVVVGSALALNTVLSGLLGGTIPLVLKGFKLDPALASGPILTTVTDMCGFFFVLSFATLVLAQLTV